MSRVKSNLDHLRWVAAFAVVFQHARSLVMIDYHPDAGMVAKALYFATGFSHQAVVIFFVLSGYLVGGAAIRLLRSSSADQRRRFAVDRFVRIFIVLLPALTLTGLVAALAPSVPAIASDNWGAAIPNAAATSTVSAWVGTGFLVNEILTGTTPYNGALWSLAFEWTYYVLAAGAVFMAARDRRPGAMLLYIYAAALLILCAMLAPAVLAMGLYWLAGAAASRIDRLRLPYLTIPIFAATLIATRFDFVGQFAADLSMALATALLIADQSFQRRSAFEQVGTWLASFSYSLYAIHWPILLGAIAAIQGQGLLLERLSPGPYAYLLIGLLIALSYGAAVLFASLTEQRTAMIRRWLYGAMPHISSPPLSSPRS